MTRAHVTGWEVGNPRKVSVTFTLRDHHRNGGPDRVASRSFIALAWVAFCLVCLSGACAEPGSLAEPLPIREPTNSQPALPREVPVIEDTNTQSPFRIKAGFKIELVASEPMVVAPVALAFDENGRLFVAESPGRFGTSPTNATLTPSGNIRMLQDADGKGVFTSSVVYASDVPSPAAVTCFDGGVFVASASDILYFKDSKQDGIADLRKVVFTGLGGTNASGTRIFPNYLGWGIDNRIHGAVGGMDGILDGANPARSALLSSAGQCFSFDPVSPVLSAEAGSAQSGLVFDNFGRRFLIDLATPLRRAMYDPRYISRNPFITLPPLVADVASPATVVFRAASAQPQKAAQDSSRTNGFALAPAWLANAQGGSIYRGTEFPTNFHGNVFIADPGTHLIHRMLLRENGLETTAIRAPDERDTEFLVSKDASFEPVQVVNGPDGALYIADFHGGNGFGRIYRVAPEKFEAKGPPGLGRSTTRELATTLAHPDGWHRDTAARLLLERHDPAALSPLTNLLITSRSAVTRLHALRALDGGRWLTATNLFRGLADPDDRVRDQAVLLVEKFLNNGNIPDGIWRRLRIMCGGPLADPSIRVRYQLAFTLGEIRRPDRAEALAAILSRDRQDPWIRAAVLSSLTDGAGQLFVALGNDPKFRDDAAGQAFLRQLALVIGMRGRMDEVGQTLDFIARANLSPLHGFAFLQSVGEGLRRTHSSLALIDPQGRLNIFYDRAMGAAVEGRATEPVRVEAIRLLGVAPYPFEATGDWLFLLLGSGQTPSVQSAAIATLTSYRERAVVSATLARWTALPPVMRGDALSSLLDLPDRIPAVLDAIERGKIASGDVPQAWVDLLRTFPEPAIRQRAVRLFGSGFVDRPDVVKQYRPALKLKCAPARGHFIFQTRCASCHRVGSEGNDLGPNLALAAIASKENVLEAVLEPNAHRSRGYVTGIIQTRDSRLMIGLISNENAETVTVRQPNGVQIVWPRANIQFLDAQPWSLMPERRERLLTVQDMADLLEFLAPTLKATATP
jgi:putative membrane-bound dehydrogenase-like protein